MKVPVENLHGGGGRGVKVLSFAHSIGDTTRMKERFKVKDGVINLDSEHAETLWWEAHEIQEKEERKAKN